MISKSSPDINPNALLVCMGPPRSGLNLLSTCLSIVGIKPLEHQPDAGTINRLLFQDLGHSEFAPAMPRNWQQTTTAQKAKTRIHSLLLSGGFLDKQADQARAETKSACHLTINNALTLDLWLQALIEFSIRPKLILMLRHPWETALSLAANYNLDLQRGHILWLAHTRAVLHQLSSQPTNYQITNNKIITFDQLLADPVSTIRNAIGLLLTSLRGVGSSGPEADHRLPSETFTRCNTRSVLQSKITPWTPWEFPQGFHWGPLTSDLLDYVQPSLKRYHVSNMPEEDREVYRPYAQLYEQLRVEGLFHTVSDLTDSLLQAVGQKEHTTNLSQPPYSKSGTAYRRPLSTDHSQTTTGLYAEVIFPSSSAQGEVTRRIPLLEDQWQKIELPVLEPELLRINPIRVQPMNTNGIVRIAGMRLVNKSTGQHILDYSSTEDFDRCKVEGSSLRLPDKESLLLMITGDQSVLHLHASEDIDDFPLEFVIWMKAGKDQGALINYLDKFAPVSKNKSETEFKQLKNELSILSGSLQKIDSQIIKRLDKLEINLLKHNKKLAKNEYRQWESLTWLLSLVSLKKSPMPLRNWAMSPDSLLFIYEKILEQQPKLIVELGSGLSTVIFADALRKNGQGKIISFDHEEEFGHWTQNRISEEKLDEYAEVRIAYLVPWQGKHLSSPEDNPLWYNKNYLSDLKEVEMILVDGPPGKTCRYARYPAIPALFDKTTSNCLIIMDDANRAEDIEICNSWAAGYDLNIQVGKSFDKGICILSKLKLPRLV